MLRKVHNGLELAALVIELRRVEEGNPREPLRNLLRCYLRPPHDAGESPVDRRGNLSIL
jgi:hypothetical protein